MIKLKVKINGVTTDIIFDEPSNYDIYLLDNKDYPITSKVETILSLLNDNNKRDKLKEEINSRPGLVIGLVNKLTNLVSINGKQTTQDKLIEETSKLSQTILYELYSVIMKVYPSYDLIKVRDLTYRDLFTLATMAYTQTSVPYYLDYVMNRDKHADKYKEQTGNELTYDDYILILANDGKITDIHNVQSEKDKREKMKAQQKAHDKLRAKQRNNLTFEQLKGLDGDKSLGENFEPSNQPDNNNERNTKERQMDIQSHAEASASNSLKHTLAREKILKQKGVKPNKAFNWKIDPDVRFG